MAERRANLIREMAGSKRGTSWSGSEAGSARDKLPGGWDTYSEQIPARRPEPDFQINTSALKRAFPDFSQHGSSGEDSIEVGRGYHSTRNTPSKTLPSEEVSQVMPFSFGDGAQYQLTGTPPIKGRKPSTQLNKEKEVSVNEFNEEPGKRIRATSNSSGRASHDSKKTLVGLPATVESDDSVHSVEFSGAVDQIPTRGSRFSSTHARNGNSAATRSARKPTEQAIQDGTSHGGKSGTYQSFMIPDMPNITELISGERENGTPLFHHTQKPRSRFVTPSNAARTLKTSHASHLPVNSVPLPAEVKALYASLQLLQEKVAALESEKASSEKILEANELELLRLKSWVQEQEHARSTDSGIEADAEDNKVKGLKGENMKLETSLRVLQERLDRANKKNVKSNAQIASLTKDRDALHKQLGVAYLESKEHENTQVLDGEVLRLQTELRRVTRSHKKEMDKLGRQEAELRGKIERREKAIDQMASLAKELFSTRNALTMFEETARAGDVPVAKAVRPPQIRHQKDTTDTRTAAFSTIDVQHNIPARGQSMQDLAEVASDGESTTNIRLHRTKTDSELSVDPDFLSFMDGDEVAKLKHVLEEDKARLSQSNGRMEHLPERNTTVGRKDLPRKSSLKKVSYGDLSQRSFGQDQHTHQTNESFASEHRRRSVRQSDTTSAFILPDITLRSEQFDAQRIAKNVTAVDQHIKTKISRPIPVSSRPPVANSDLVDATIRPAQDPAIALATVLSGLENEISQLRTDLVEQQKLYNAHDPALSKRRRKMVYARIQQLLVAIERRSDQVYALYDVLEGQKMSGQTMKEEEVEITLIELGLNPEVGRSGHTSVAGNVVGLDKDISTKAQEDSDSDSGDEDLPPWDGFETTQTQTLEGLSRIAAAS